MNDSTLEKYYGSNFRAVSLEKTSQLEGSIPKYEEIEQYLNVT